jgi:NDP-hexose-3-ketoreductase
MKIGILNCSDIARRRMIPAMKKITDIEISVICSREIKKAKEFAKEFDIPRYTDDPNDLKNIDAVYISSPPSEHAEWIEFFLNRGVNIICEKSLTTSLNETKRLIGLAEEKGLLIMENYAFQFHPQWIWINQQIESGILGEILSVKSAFEFPARPNPEEDFRYKPELGGGALLDCGGYPLMVANLLSGEFISSKSHQIMKGDLDVYGSSFICDENRTFHLSWGMEAFYRCDLEILGTKGRIISKKIFTPKADEIVPVYMEIHGSDPEIYEFLSDQFEEMLKVFIADIKDQDFYQHQVINRQSELQEYAKITSIRTILK